MHEAGIAERILELVLARADEADATRVTAVELEAGEDAGVSREAVEFHWQAAARGTLAQDAVLRFLAVDDDPTAFRLVAIEADGLSRRAAAPPAG